MANSSPTIHETIRHKAQISEYIAARSLGYPPMQAAASANEVGKFIDRIAGQTIEGIPR